MISKKGRFIFFHIPRTGGSAVQDCLWGGYTNTQTGTHPRENPDYYAPYNWHAHGFNREPNKKDRPPEVIEYEGKVIDIDLRYTTIEADGKKVLIPNSTLFTKEISILN